jgi:hypothetical protein
VSNVEDLKSRPQPDPKLAELASKINSEYASIIKADKDVMAANHNIVERGIILGQILNEAKDKVAHGEWLPWLKLNCPEIPERTAQRYMYLSNKAATVRKKMKSATMADLTLKAALDLVDDKKTTTRDKLKPLDRFENAWDKLDLPTQQAFVEAKYNDISKLMKEVDRKEKKAA